MEATRVDSSAPLADAASIAGLKRRRKREKELGIVAEKSTKLIVELRPDGRKRTRKIKVTRWKLIGHYVDGKRRREYFVDEETAKARLAALKLQRENLGARAARIDGGLAEDAVRAERELAPFGLSVLEAIREYTAARQSLAGTGESLLGVAKARAAQYQARRSSLSLSRLGAAFLKDRTTNGASRFYLDDARRRWRRLEEWSGSDTPACEVTPEVVTEFLDSLGVSAQSRGNFQRNLGAVFSFGAKRGYVARNPFAVLDKPKVRAKPPAVFTPLEMKQLLAHAAADWLPVLAIGGFAGLRPEEIRRLEWRHIDFERGLIEVEAAHSKTAQRRLVAISANLKAWLAPYEGRTGRVAPVPGTERKRRLAAMKAAGVSKWPVDVLRHSFASYHLAVHENAAKLALDMGHTSPKMIFAHYREIVKPDTALAWWALMPEESKGRKVIRFRRGAVA